MNPNRPNANPQSPASSGITEGRNPQWQVLTGLTPEAEPKMSPEVRDEKIRILIKEVERRAKLEIDRADKCPDGERTVYWDPTEAACQDLGISRVKLSAYSRRLRGMRAQEIGDKLKAALVKPKIEAWVAEEFKMWWEFLGGREKCIITDPAYASRIAHELGKEFRERMKFKKNRDAANRFAIKVGFPNITRLRKACVLAFETTLDAIMGRIAYDMVQKCVDQKAAELRRGTVPAPSRGAGVSPASAVGSDANKGGAQKLEVPAFLLEPLEMHSTKRYTEAEIEQMEKEFEAEMMKDEEAA